MRNRKKPNKRGGRPTLEESAADPFSGESVRRALLFAGVDLGEQLGKINEDIDQIEDPAKRAEVRIRFQDLWMPYTHRKKGSEDKHEHSLEITCSPELLQIMQKSKQQLPPTSQHTVIDITPSTSTTQQS